MTPWGQIPLASVANTTVGNLTQLYPSTAGTGTTATTPGSLRLQPCEGIFTIAQVETDGADGGSIEIWDINGRDVGADVNMNTAITPTQLAAAVRLGIARLVFAQNFVGSAGARVAIAQGCPFTHGLAARYINSTGTCYLSLTVDGGFRKTEITGIGGI